MGFFAPFFRENWRKLGNIGCFFLVFPQDRQKNSTEFVPNRTEVPVTMADRQRPGEPEQELRRLSRKDLIDIIYELRKQEEVLRHELELARQELENRDILLEETGSIAEAALKLNGVFEAAQAAADQYLRSVKATHPAKGES